MAYDFLGFCSLSSFPDLCPIGWQLGLKNGRLGPGRILQNWQLVRIRGTPKQGSHWAVVWKEADMDSVSLVLSPFESTRLFRNETLLRVSGYIQVSSPYPPPIPSSKIARLSPLSHAFCSIKGLFLTVLCMACLKSWQNTRTLE